MRLRHPCGLQLLQLDRLFSTPNAVQPFGIVPLILRIDMDHLADPYVLVGIVVA